MEKLFVRNIKYYSQRSVWSIFSLERQLKKHKIETWEIDERNLKIIYEFNLFSTKKEKNVENNNCPLNIRFVAKTSDIRNFSQNIRSDVKTSDAATLDGSMYPRCTGSGFRTRIRQDSAHFEQTWSDPGYGFIQVFGSEFSNIIVLGFDANTIIKRIFAKI